MRHGSPGDWTIPEMDLEQSRHRARTPTRLGGAGPAGVRAGLGGVRTVLAVARMPVAADLATDGGRAAAQLGGDRPDVDFSGSRPAM
jgi:hypothetical protein